MKKLLITILFLFFIITSAYAASPYYVDLNAGGTNSGTYTNPWNNMATVNAHSFSEGDDLYFKVSGSVHTMTQALTVDWNGTEEDPAIIGCYDGEGDFDCGSSRATLDGDSWTIPGVASWSGLITNNQSTPIGNYVTIQDLKLQNSGGYGIEFGSLHASTSLTSITVDNVYIYRSYRPGVLLHKVTNSTIQDCEAHDNNYPSVTGGAGIEISGINVSDMTDNNTITRNKVSGGFEGIGAYKKAKNTTIEYNAVWDTQSYAIYIGSSLGSIVRHNLVYFTPAVAKKNAIVMDFEDEREYCYGGEVEIYGNLIAGAKRGITLGIEIDSCTIDGNRVYNNTIVDCCHNFVISSTGSGSAFTDTIVKNNISWAITPGDSYHEDGCSESGVTWDDNVFYGGSLPSGICESGEVNVNPALVKTSGWRSLTGGAVTGGEFQLTSLTPTAVSQGGTNLGDSLEYVLIPDSCDFTATPITCTPADADDYAWPIGAFLGEIPYLSAPYPTSLQDCPDDGVFGFTSNSNANCKYSEKGTDTCDTDYTDLDSDMTTGQGGTSHEEDVGTPDCGASKTYVCKCQDTTTSLISNCLEITIDVAAGGGPPPQPAPGLIIGGGNVTIVSGGNRVIH